MVKVRTIVLDWAGDSLLHRFKISTLDGVILPALSFPGNDLFISCSFSMIVSMITWFWFSAVHIHLNSYFHPAFILCCVSLHVVNIWIIVNLIYILCSVDVISLVIEHFWGRKINITASKLLLDSVMLNKLVYKLPFRIIISLGCKLSHASRMLLQA